MAEFDAYLETPMAAAEKNAHFIGVLYGFSQFIQNITFTTLFYFSALFLVKKPIQTEDPVQQSEDSFIAVFAMIFGAFAAGQANQFGPDFGKAKIAATNIF